MKNLLLFSTILLTAASAFAQLSVKPNGVADSYVYVKNQVLYVTSDINLTRNSTANNTEASIYLRENGQLIQGGTTSTNSGSGQLSAQQNSPETNAYAYYYWCSPVGYPGTTIAPQPAGNPWAGVINIYEAQPSLGLTAARPSLTTTNREGLILPRMTISTRWLYTFKTPGTETEGNYQRINANTAVPAGYGFTMKGLGLIVPGADQVYEFRGRPNNGNFKIPVAEPVITLPNPLPISQMTLAGNPYPSALDLNQLFYETGNEELAALWYYDEDRTVASHNYSQKPFGYGIWIPDSQDSDLDFKDNFPTGTYTKAPFYIYNAGGVGGGSTTGDGGNDQNKRYAPIGQGIMFVGGYFNIVAPFSDGFVNIRNSQRIFVKEDNVTTGGSVFQRPDTDENNDLETENNAAGGPTLSSSAEISRDKRTSGMRLWVVFDNAVTRDMVLNFSNLATDGYDRGMDGASPQDLKTDAYFPVGNDNSRMPYVISAINYDDNKQVPIAFKLDKQTQIELRVMEEVKKPYKHAYLFDSQENTYKALSSTDAARVSLTLPAGKYENRFFIVFRSPFIKKDAPLAEVERTEIVQKSVNFFQNNPQHQLEVSNPEGYKLKSASVYDMSGKLVLSESNLGDNNKYSFYTGNLSDGVYLVKLMTSDNIAIDYKAIVHN